MGGAQPTEPRTSEAAGAAGALDIPSITAYNGCTQDDYVDRSADADDRTIAIAKVGLTFTPKCMIVARGQLVRWEGNLSAHPLAAGNPQDPNAGSPSSPILDTSSGSSVEFAFRAAGVFPYYCQIHAFGAGQGMAGVVVAR